MLRITLPTDTQYYNANNISGFPPGNLVLITNLTTDPLYVAQSVTQPVNDNNSFPVLDGKTVVVTTGDTPIWLKGSSGTIVVQDFNSVVLPSEAINPRVMIGHEAFTTQGFVEANCKNGTQYEVSTYTNAFAPGTSRDVIVITGSKPVLVKNREFTFTGSEVTTAIYRSPVYTGGSVSPYYNLSDINPQVGETVLMVGATVTDVGVQISPTYTLIGNIPQTGQAVNATDAENSLSGLERVLRPNTTYLFRTTNPTLASMTLSTKASWYEGHLSSIAF